MSPRQSKTIYADKRITPFSIDDILSKSEVRDWEHCKDDRTNCDSNDFAPENLKFSEDMNGKLRLWTQENYLKWLENLHRLYSTTTLKPFWFPDYRPRTELFGRHLDTLRWCCPKRPHDDLAAHKAFIGQEQRAPLDRRSSWEGRGCLKRRRSPSAAQSDCSESENKFKAKKVLENRLKNGETERRSWSSSDSEDGLNALPIGSNESDRKDSPLSALERLTCSTFKGMEEKQHDLHAVAAGREVRAKRRKCRTAFTAFQLSVLEQRFACHKYLTPADRDQIAHVLGLSAPQVITWFQNRRAKLKRDVEEMRNDIKTVQKWEEKSQEISSPKKEEQENKK
ncbi:uncharacterized protein LOC143459717 isoform X2 [Clavelina lepadiformis]